MGKMRSVIFAGRVLLCIVPISEARPAESGDPAQLLKQADDIKTADNTRFLEIVHDLDSEPARLTPAQQQSLRYLKAWQLGYTGEYETAVPALKAVIAEATDLTLRFRAQISLVNDQALASHYEEAYAGLNELLDTQAQVPDKETRMLGFAVASLLYNQAGQYDLGLDFAERWLAEDNSDVSACKAMYLKLDALFRSGRLKVDDPQVQDGINACRKIHEPLAENVIRSFVANLYMADGRVEDALRLLRENDATVQQTHSARITSEFHSILARCYLLLGDLAQAKQYAQSAIDKSIKKEFSKPLVDAYGVLYEVAKREGDISKALAYHEKFATADKGYLSDTTARTIAYQMVNQQLLDKKHQIDVLNERNQVLQLEGEVASKAAETERLYVVLLIVGLVSIALWAYRTKRSQVRFQKIARRDGLTGIVNRQHFMDEAVVALKYCAKSKREVSLILIDLDHFKAVNDTHGHAAGDSVLKQTVTTCQQYMRSIDLFGRLGGEEFGVLLPDCGLEIAGRRAEELRCAIAESVRVDPEMAVSASFGATSTLESGYDLRQMLIHADSALYQAKRAGRNRVQVVDSVLAAAPAHGA
ncbi:MAG TPA: GGDEF domain-containing protein [Rudaea sp.]|jgi:diguanylate cyclase (GGDEF)-like protein